MRKLIQLLILIIVLSLMLSVATAEQEILFRNIPWGLSLTELTKLDFMGNSLIYDSSMPYEDRFIIQYSVRTMLNYATDFDAGYEVKCYTGGGKVKVAGYEITRINMYCAYSIDGDVLLKDKKDSRLFAAEYDFEPLDYQYAYNSLVQKLTDLYGQGTDDSSIVESWMGENDHFDDVELEYNIVTWDGMNDTHVVIVGYWLVDEDKYANTYSSSARNMMKKLFIVYYKGGMDEELRKISKMEQQLEIMKEKQSASGNDGL